MTTTPEATKGVPRHEGNSTFTPRADHNSLADWVLANTDTTVANVASLPVTDNWVGREVLTEDLGEIYRCTALPNTWALVASTDRTGTVTSGINGWSTSAEMVLSKRSGWVTLQGSFTHASHTPGTSVQIGTIPLGFRPLNRVGSAVVLYSAGQLGSADFEPDGDIFLNNPGTVTGVTAVRFSVQWKAA
jgi:hypothetical protein